MECLIVRIAQDILSSGSDRIVGVLSKLEYKVSDKTVGNILRRNGLAPAPERKKTTTWRDFIRTHRNLLFGRTLFTAEVWTHHGLVTFCILFFIRVASRKVHFEGMTPHPNQGSMAQIARNVTMEGFGFFKSGDFVRHDRDRKFCRSSQRVIESVGITWVDLPTRSPNLNVFAESWIRSIKEECLSRVILFGESSLRCAIVEYVEHYHQERNHQGRGKIALFRSSESSLKRVGPIQRRERLGGLLKYPHRQAA